MPRIHPWTPDPTIQTTKILTRSNPQSRGGSYIPALMQEENRLQPLASCAVSRLQSSGLGDSIVD